MPVLAKASASSAWARVLARPRSQVGRPATRCSVDTAPAYKTVDQTNDPTYRWHHQRIQRSAGMTNTSTPDPVGMVPFGPILVGQTEKTLQWLLRHTLAGTGLSEPEWVALRLATMV